MAEQDTLDPQTQDTQDPAITTTTKWQDTLPEDIKADPIFAKFKEPAEAYRSLVAAQKFLGREKLPVPKDANDKETYSMIFKTLGLPEKPDGYVLPTDLQIPKDLPFNEAMLTDFKKIAHEQGILPQQFAGLYKWYMNNMVGQYQKFNEQKVISTQEAENNLRQKWGAAYPQNVALAKKVFQSFADEKAYAKFDSGLGNDPDMIEFFANLGKVLSEDQLAGKPKGLEMTPDEAQTEVNKIKGDKSHAYWNESHPTHKEAVAHMERLMKFTLLGQ